MPKPENEREMFDTMADQIISNAQATIRAMPALPPTTAYKLAISFGLEQFANVMLTGLKQQLYAQLEAAKAELKKNDDRT
jgi:hypothetical protein